MPEDMIWIGAYCTEYLIGIPYLCI